MENLEQTMMRMFEKTLLNDQNDHYQKIIHHQAKLLQSKQQPPPKLTDNTQVLNIQKKLQAIERNFIMDTTQRKRRHSRIEHRSKTNSIYESSHLRTPTQPFDCDDDSECEIVALKRENAKLQERVTQLEIAERETHLRVENELAILKQEQDNLIKLKSRYQEQEKQVQQKIKEIDTREIQMNNFHSQMLAQQKKLEEQRKYLDTQEKQSTARRENMEQLQSKLNQSIGQLFTLNKNDLKDRVQAQMGVQLEAIEQLVQSTFKERQVIQQEQVYLRQLREAINAEKREMLELRDQSI